MLKRIGLFLGINFAVLMTIGVVTKLLGIDRYLTENGVNYTQLLIFSALFGFAGSFISLMMSKSIAKISTGAAVISKPRTSEEAWLVSVVQELAQKAGVRMPEVAIYRGTANAFATGAFRDESLVAVSTGLLETMTRPQIRAVLAHEMSHVKNGDMVTMTLLQGVLNTFVFFFARVIAIFLHNRGESRDDRRQGIGFGYYITVQVCEVLFGILASIVACGFSRHREYRADAGAAELLGSPEDMIRALQALGGVEKAPLPSEMKAFGIVDLPSLTELFSTHPPLEDRIRALAADAGKGRPRKRTGGLFGTIE